MTLVLASSAGGVGRHVADLARGLAAADSGAGPTAAGQGGTSQVRVIGPGGSDRRFGFSSPAVGFDAVEIADRPRPVPDLRALALLRRLLAGRDVVHAHGLRAGALSVLATRSLPRSRRPAVVVTLHNALVSGGRIAAVHAVLERIVARGAAAVLVVSDDVGEGVRRRGAARVERALIPAPVPGPPPAPAPPASTEPAGGQGIQERSDDPAAITAIRTEVRTRIRAEFGIRPDQAVLLTVARLAEQKGLPHLLDALAGLRQQHPDLPFHALIAGEGPLHDELAARIATDQVPATLLGARDDVPDLLVAADVFVLPSLWEGQPLAVQEALRAGTAIVATDAGGTAAVVGDGAVLVPPADPATLAEAVAALLADPPAAEALRERALRAARSLPSTTDAVRQVRRLYAEVLR